MSIVLLQATPLTAWVIHSQERFEHLLPDLPWYRLAGQQPLLFEIFRLDSDLDCAKLSQMQRAAPMASLIRAHTAGSFSCSALPHF